jgi:hypothetical protein
MNLHYALAMLLIQLVNIFFMIIGIPIVGVDVLLGKPEPWLWENSDDPPPAAWSRWKAFVWLALRNPVANFRFVPGVSGKGRPLFYRTWFWTIRAWHKQFYVKIGWLGNGYPACNWGGGKGY